MMKQLLKLIKTFFFSLFVVAVLTACDNPGSKNIDAAKTSTQVYRLSSESLDVDMFYVFEGSEGNEDLRKGSVRLGELEYYYLLDDEGRVSYIQDQDGSVTLIHYYPSRIDYVGYDSEGKFTEGAAVLINPEGKPEGIYTAELKGYPYFVGDITLYLEGLGVGEFKIEPDDIPIGNLAQVSSPNLVNFATPILADAEGLVPIALNISCKNYGVMAFAVAGVIVAEVVTAGLATAVIAGAVAGGGATFGCNAINRGLDNAASAIDRGVDNISTAFEKLASMSGEGVDGLKKELNYLIDDLTPDGSFIVDEAKDVADKFVNKASSLAEIPEKLKELSNEYLPSLPTAQGIGEGIGSVVVGGVKVAGKIKDFAGNVIDSVSGTFSDVADFLLRGKDTDIEIEGQLGGCTYSGCIVSGSYSNDDTSNAKAFGEAKSKVAGNITQKLGTYYLRATAGGERIFSSVNSQKDAQWEELVAYDYGDHFWISVDNMLDEGYLNLVLRPITKGKHRFSCGKIAFYEETPVQIQYNNEMLVKPNRKVHDFVVFMMDDEDTSCFIEYEVKESTITGKFFTNTAYILDCPVNWNSCGAKDNPGVIKGDFNLLILDKSYDD